jgi:hypothetical protein
MAFAKIIAADFVGGNCFLSLCLVWHPLPGVNKRCFPGNGHLDDLPI